MKKKIRQLFHTDSVSRANSLILTLYLWFILGTSLFLYTLSLSRLLFFVLLVVLLFVLLALSPILLNLTHKLQIPDIATLKEKNALRTRHEKRVWILFFFTISLGIFLLYYLAYYPGGFSNDSVNQYEQSISGRYNDWHPALHTFLAFTLPLMVSGGNIAAITLFQILYFASVLTYAFYILRCFSGKIFSVVSFLIVILNPATGRMAMYPWKDVAFAITALWMFTFVLQLVMTRGLWLHAPLHMILFAVVWACTTIFRHNAVLLTAPLLIGVLLYGFTCHTQKSQKNIPSDHFSPLQPDSKKAANTPAQSDTCAHKETSGRQKIASLLTCLLSILIFFFIKGPVYTALGVEKPGGRQLETMGLPLTIICDVRTDDPSALDNETKGFTDRLADDEVWDTYTLGSFGGIKWKSHYDLIDDVPASEILRMTTRCFFISPKVSVAAVIRLTDMVYTVSQGIDWAIDTPMVWPNKIGHTGAGNKIMAEGLEKYFSFTLSLPRILFYYIGIINLLVMICLLAFHKWKEFESWRRFFVVVPLFTYNFGTMLLLTNNDYRLFYYSFLIAPLLLFILLVPHHGTEKN